jgi:CRP/FNR family transcriptional regulator, cyclic AMP receptor protein
LKQILRKILSAKQLQEGVAWKRHQFPANTVIVKKGDIGKTLFYIETGTLRVAGDVELDGDKHMQTGVCDLGEGSIFGEICLHQSQVRIASVTTATDVELLEIDGESLSVFLDDNPIQGYLFYKKLFEIMINRLDVANQRIENLMAWGLKVHDIEKYL